MADTTWSGWDSGALPRARTSRHELGGREGVRAVAALEGRAASSDPSSGRLERGSPTLTGLADLGLSSVSPGR